MTTMTIGEVIDVLKLAKEDMLVWFTFCGLSPTKVLSWRGSYNEAAIGFDHDGRIIKVKEMLRDLEEAISGKLFEGYKGGKYTFTRQTQLHVDNYGQYTNTIIKSVKIKEYAVYINTKHED